MISSVGSSNTAGLATALMKEKTAQMDVAVTVVKKAQDIEKAKGESALKLIDAAAVPVASGRIDVRA